MALAAADVADDGARGHLVVGREGRGEVVGHGGHGAVEAGALLGVARVEVEDLDAEGLPEAALAADDGRGRRLVPRRARLLVDHEHEVAHRLAVARGDDGTDARTAPHVAPSPRA